MRLNVNGKYIAAYSQEMNLLEELKKRFNFQTNLLNPDDWGDLVNNSWTGVFGQVYNRVKLNFVVI